MCSSDLARGMLTSAGLSFKDLGRIEYARYPQAGLTALQMGVSEATVVRKGEWEQWSKINVSDAHVISSTGVDLWALMYGTNLRTDS